MQQSKLASQLRGLLRAGSFRSAYFPSTRRFLNLRCVKALYCDEEDLGSELQEGALRVSLFSETNKATCFDVSEEEALSVEFQPQLLQYRLENFQAAQRSVFDAPGFTTAGRELARSLGASVCDDPNLTSGIASLLESQEEAIGISQATRPDVALIVSLLALLHEKKERRVPVNKITDCVNAAIRTGGEIKEYSPVEIGSLLSRLKLKRSRNAGGMIVEFTRDLSRRVHELKVLYSITTSPASFPGCPDCEPIETPGNMATM